MKITINLIIILQLDPKYRTIKGCIIHIELQITIRIRNLNRNCFKIADIIQRVADIIWWNIQIFILKLHDLLTSIEQG
ncbi:unnamed protein product [Paramecium octaurelia]|uniref:Uncharacterized protein n=1 Tax=Paramecium octaurelia TaxID=43137 RepID=A0A8S1VQ17_PAROT|nr:unnamed protein product [Paramecium octaurelia]